MNNVYNNNKLFNIVCQEKIILYGSVSRGEDTPDSDVDLFIVSSNPERVSLILKKKMTGRKIQAVIKTPSEIPDFSEKEKVYYHEIQKGIVLKEDRE